MANIIKIMIPPDGDTRGMNLPDFMFEKEGEYKISPKEREWAWKQMIAAGRIAKKPKKSLSKADKLVLARHKKMQALEKALLDAWGKNKH
ncbi:MAG: hypothetical protein QME12_07010 [Nanoarchaeota archaeon]|nr:hypothetical protein [Nanoarchaeota archaeon]